MPQESGSLAGITVEVAAKDPEKVKIFKTRTSYEIPEPTGDDDPLIDLVLSLELEKGKYVLARSSPARSRCKRCRCKERAAFWLGHM